MDGDPLFNARVKIAKSSLLRAQQRISLQKQQFEATNEVDYEAKFDEAASSFSTFQNLCTEYGDSSVITKGKFNSNGRYFGTVGHSGQGIIWNTENHNQASFCQQVTNLKGNGKLYDVSFHPRVGQIPAFAPNVATGADDGKIFIWTMDPTSPEQKSLTLTGHSQRVNAVEFHPDGNTFVSASYDRSWNLWDAKRLKEISKQKGHLKEIHSLSVHGDGSLIATGDLGGYGMIWDLRTGRGIYQIEVASSILCSCFHPNGYELAVGGKSNTISIFDMRRKKEIKVIPAHTKLVSDLQYSADGHVLLSGSHDNTAKIWHGRQYTLINELEQSSKVTSVSLRGDSISATMINGKWSLWINSKTI